MIVRSFVHIIPECFQEQNIVTLVCKYVRTVYYCGWSVGPVYVCTYSSDRENDFCAVEYTKVILSYSVNAYIQSFAHQQLCWMGKLKYVSGYGSCFSV